jgi:FMN phosphatase YigB (HAD superfamily)
MAGTMSLLSLDVFDTLLTRVYARPADVFTEVAQALAAAALLPGQPGEWIQRRLAIEAGMWRDGSRAVTLEAIYAALGERDGWSEEQVRRAMAIEIEAEIAAHAAVPALRSRIEAWRRSGGNVAFVSDMYLPSPALRRSLQRHGWIEPGDHLFVSGDCQATKAGGRMFSLVMEHTGVAAHAITHIGDNQRADVVIPQRLGMNAEHFTNVALNRFELRAAGAGGVAAHAASLYAGCMRLARLDGLDAATSAEASSRHDAIWRIGTGVAGPVLTAFTLWVLQRAAALGVRRLYFLARDGQILYRIAQTLEAQRRYGIELRYLYASRQAWHPPAIVSLDESDFDWLFDATAGGPTLNQIAARLTVPRDLLALACAACTGAPMDPDAPLQPADIARLKQALASAPLRAIVLERSAAVREEALGYLRQEGLFEQVPYALVDIGWNGRLQRSLGKMLATAGDRPTPGTLGFYFGLWQKSRACAEDRMEGFFHDPDRHNARRRPLCNGPLLEQFTEADHGTTLGYGRLDTQWQPVLKEARNTVAIEWGLEIQHAAILAFARQVQAHFLPRVTDIPKDLLESLPESLLDEFLFRPDLAEADAYGSFEKTGAQEHGDQAELAPRIGALVAMRLALLGQGRFGRAGDPRVLWLPGSLTRSGLSWMNRWVRFRNALGQQFGH